MTVTAVMNTIFQAHSLEFTFTTPNSAQVCDVLIMSVKEVDDIHASAPSVTNVTIPPGMHHYK